MKSIYISTILIFIVLNSCSKKQNKDNITNLNTHSKMSNVNLANTNCYYKNFGNLRKSKKLESSWTHAIR